MSGILGRDEETFQTELSICVGVVVSERPDAVKASVSCDELTE
jgi:hypothetical protein